MINECEYRIIFADTDAMGIVYHGKYIELFEMGRTEFLREFGFPYSKFEEEGIWLPVGSVTASYKTPGKVDDLMVIRSRIKELRGASVTMAYQIVNKETGAIYCTGTSTHPMTTPDLKPFRFKRERPELYKALADTIEEDFDEYKPVK